jgi:adenylylsulfate kinase-like enzyme
LAKIIWLTGLSGAGKTTLSKKINSFLKYNNKCLIIDGDSFRKKNKQFSFTKKNISKNNLQIIDYCKKNFNKYDYIIVSVISPLKKTRFYANRVFKKNYFEIYVFASIKVLEKRDTKGLYALSKKGLIDNLIGYNSKINYEKSEHQHLRINTNILSLENSLKKILLYSKVRYKSK